MKINAIKSWGHIIGLLGFDAIEYEEKSEEQEERDRKREREREREKEKERKREREKERKREREKERNCMLASLGWAYNHSLFACWGVRERKRERERERRDWEVIEKMVKIIKKSVVIKLK